ncbi:MAG TPA: hypothetical protein VNH46_07590 [Gemmatimonadales bacterium]|nr:hypothetical protein [Gemmatimonadales bacterium]
MRTIQRSWRRAAYALLLPPAALLGGCGDSGYGGVGPVQETGPAVQFGIWTPDSMDTCTPQIHDQYSVVGPDGKRYNTWHPPVDPATGCSFGHEHGRDPRGSHLYAKVGPIPFGLANEALETWDPQHVRHEDHYGHKIDWENDAQFVRQDGVTGTLFSVKCDVLVKLHQGTHSKDAFTNNLHELAYHIACSDGTEMHITLMAAIGRAGEFIRSCDGTAIDAGAPTPSNSPNGGGQRLIPDRTCVDRYMRVGAGQSSDYDRALHESWQTSNSVRTDGGRTIASFNPYFQVFLPSRFYDPSLANVTGRPIEVCYETGPNGEKAVGGPCGQSTNNGQIQGLTFDDPRSAFNGVHRFFDINDNNIDNKDGPEVWYTDPFGKHAQQRPFPGSIRQWIAKIKNDYGFSVNGPAIGGNRNYGAASVHAPN